MQINIKLDDNFSKQFEQLRADYGPELARLNGFAEEQLNYTDFIDNFIDKDTVADATIDANANVGTKDVCSLLSEMNKPHSKLLAFNKIYHDMAKLWGDDAAHQWLIYEWDGHYYLHDASTSTLKGYCFAFDIKPLVEKGLYFVGNFNAQPPKHLVTFTDFVGEFVSYTSNRSSGACGLPSFLVYSFYFWKKDCESNYLGMKTQEDFERYRDQEFQRIIYKLNQPYLRVNQSAFTNFSIFDQSYYTELFGGLVFPDGTFAIDYLDDFIEYQKAFMRVVSKIREQNMLTFPVLTYSLLYRDGKFVNEDFAKWCCDRNMYWADSNFFVSSDVTSLSNCCRLVSDVKSLGYFNSLGGTALEVGSVKVNTINLARIAYESDKEAYMERLKELTTLCCVTLDTQRHIIQRDIEKGLLPNYTHELLHLSSQYSTIGVIGIYEALEHYGLTAKDEFGDTYYTDEAIAFAQELFKTIHETKDAFLKDNARDYQINIEQIPAERAASILMEKDKLFFPDEAYELPLYGNQFIPLGIKCTIQEKIRLSALLDRACNGGSIAHINIDAPFASFESAWDALNYVARSGVVYFAFCTRISACESNHGFYGDTCPICGKPKVTTYQRIVG